MKLLVFADSHGRPEHMLEAASTHAEISDACFYLGDGIRDAEIMQKQFPGMPVYMVQGNCDYGAFEPLEGIVPIDGLLFFYTHGHAFQVKNSLDSLWWRAKRKTADVALYGHTHQPHYELRDGVHIFCPGSISMPRFGPSTYGIITVEDKTPKFTIVKCAR